MLSAEDRSRNARIAALTRHSRLDGREATAAAARGAFARFEREVDPDNELSLDERSRRARLAQRAHMTRLAQKSAQKRRRAAS